LQFLYNNVLQTFPGWTVTAVMPRCLTFSDHQKATEGPIFCWIFSVRALISGFLPSLEEKCESVLISLWRLKMETCQGNSAGRVVVLP
jgi:hypothetical protein